MAPSCDTLLYLLLGMFVLPCHSTFLSMCIPLFAHCSVICYILYIIGILHELQVKSVKIPRESRKIVSRERSSRETIFCFPEGFWQISIVTNCGVAFITWLTNYFTVFTYFSFPYSGHHLGSDLVCLHKLRFTLNLLEVNQIYASIQKIPI